jgi:hypothetical protein
MRHLSISETVDTVCVVVPPDSEEGEIERVCCDLMALPPPIKLEIVVIYMLHPIVEFM